MTISYDEIKTLVELFESSTWDELHVEVDGLELFLSTDPNASIGHSSVPLSGTAQPAAEVRSAVTAHEAEAQAAVPANWVAVTAQHLGVFYRAPKPGAAPYVEVGQRVDVDSELCLLEVMKLFTAVKAQVAGVVRRLCARDAEMVQYGEVLFYIEPAVAKN